MFKWDCDFEIIELVLLYIFKRKKENWIKLV